MKRILFNILLLVSVTSVFAQNATKSDIRSAAQNTVVKLDGTSQNGWVKNDNDGSTNTSTPTSGNENVSYNSTSDGIYISILSGTNKIKLFALTGQLLLSGDLTQGRFFIPTRKGIYFLKVNNKSFKVICK